MKCISILLTLFMLFSCASREIRGNKLSEPSLSPVFSNTETPEGYAPLFIYRKPFERNPYGAMKVFIDDQKIIELGNGVFTKVYLRPGKHKFKLTFHEGKHEEYRAQHMSLDQPLTTDKIWLLVSDYSGKSNELIHSDFQKVRILLSEQNYLESPQKIVNSLNVTNEDKELWATFVNKNSVTAMDNFLYLYPYSPYAKDAKNRKEQLIKAEKEQYKLAFSKAGNTGIMKFLKEFPQAHNKEQALKEVIKRSQNRNDMLAVYTLSPESVKFMPLKYKYEFELFNIGPDLMKIKDIYSLLKKDKLSPGIVSAKIIASSGLYKEFSVDEIKFLQQKSIPDNVIESMITSTSKANDEIKQTQKNDELMNQIKKLIAESQQKVSSESIKKDDGNSTIECIKQKSALEACAATTSGFIKMACDAAAKASFECTSF